MKSNNPILTIVILNYNSGKYLKQCLDSLIKSQVSKYQIEVVVVDNNSTDNSFKSLKSYQHKSSYFTFHFLQLTENKGFAAGNNQGVKISSSQSKYFLFLNPDTTVNPETIEGMVDFFEQNHKVDAATCYINLASTNKMQPECHRGFPTPWRSFCYFSGLIKIFPHSKIFSGYFLGNLKSNTIHPIEACVGAFLMVKKNAGAKINWWNEKYFFYGEDLDFCFKLKQNNYHLFFNPNFKITHYQGISSGLKSQTQNITQANRTTKILVAKASTNAMRIFYQDNLIKNYPRILKYLILSGINLLELQRIFKAKYL